MIRYFWQNRFTLWYFFKPFAVILAIYLTFNHYNPLDETIINTVKGMQGGGNLVLHILFLIVLCKTTIRFGKPIYYILRAWAFIGEIIEHDCVTVFEGEPKTGKTLTMTYVAGILSEHVADEQRFKYLLQKGKEKNPHIPPFDSEDEKERFRMIEEAEQFFDEHPEMIRYLISNYPIWKGNQYSGKLRLAHFLGLSRLPEASVLVGDEIADILSNQRSDGSKTDAEKAENEQINQFSSKLRHYGDFCMTLAEQDSGEIFIGVRRVVKTNRYLERLQKVCTPDFLLWRADRIKSKVLKRDDCTHERFRQFVKLQKRINRIGFFNIDYSVKGSNVRSSKVKASGSLVFPLAQPYRYETRSYFKEYEARNKPLRVKPHTSHYVE